jgi:hypothetical protein
MFKKLDWKALDPKVAGLCAASGKTKITTMAQQLKVSTATFQRSMRRQGLKRDLKVVERG